jgi:hypothetical protein
MGITSPTAAAIGGLSAHDVETAYATVRTRLAAAALDRPTLLGGAPDAFARALRPDERSYFTHNLDNADPAQRTRSWGRVGALARTRSRCPAGEAYPG